MARGSLSSGAMARRSLFCLVMAPALTACLDPPPEYTVPDPAPPVLITSDALPLPTTTLRTSSDIVEFTVPFRSDDQGEGLVAWFVFDIPAGDPDFDHVAGRTVIPADPRRFAEQGTDRVVDFKWKWAKPGAGCHSMTMILSHGSNFLSAYDVVDHLGTAQLTWFLGLGDSGKTCGITPQASSP